MLGWQIFITTERGHPDNVLPVWKESLGGLEWIEKIVKDGNATDHGGNGYPLKYTTRVKFALEEILSHKPTDVASFESIPAYDRTIVKHEAIRLCSPDDMLVIEAWDQS